MSKVGGTIGVVVGLIVTLAGCRPLARPALPSDLSPERLLLVDEATNPQPHLQVRPVDPATLADLPGRAPLSLGHTYASAVSPDGQTLAAFVWPTDVPQFGGTLQLVDLATWTETVPGVAISASAGALGFTADGRALAWVRPTSPTLDPGVAPGYALERYDLARHARAIVARFPLTSTPLEMRRLPSGNLAVYAVAVDAANLAADAPHVLIVDPALRKITADVRLDGIKAGNYPEGDPASSDVSYRMYWPGLAWDVGRARLYVAAPDRDRVVAVDLARGAILRQADLRPRASALDRLVGWLAPRAEAKGEPATRREAALSPDGHRLYLVGSRDGEEWTSTGLDVVDTADLSLLAHRDVPATDVQVLPDGQRLTLRLVWPARAGELPREALSIRDATRLNEVGRMTLDNAFDLVGCSRDGRLAYTSQWGRAPNGTWRPQLQVVEVATQRVVAARRFDDAPGGYVRLIPTTPNADTYCLWG